MNVVLIDYDRDFETYTVSNNDQVCVNIQININEDTSQINNIEVMIEKRDSDAIHSTVEFLREYRRSRSDYFNAYSDYFISNFESENVILDYASNMFYSFIEKLSKY
jgi:hypothetical protein